MNLLLLFLYLGQVLACSVIWQKSSVKTPFSNQKVRPQGIAIDGDRLFLTNHYKDSTKMQESDLLIINKYNKSLVTKIKFPKGFNHVSGLSLTGSKFHFVDFGHESIFELDIINDSLKVREVIKLPIKGVSSISTYNKYVAVSFHILPHRYPYLKNRKIKFFDLSTGEEIQVKGEILESNKSQGLTFFKRGDDVYLAESINMFSSVLKYWITGLDDQLDLLRIYKVDFENNRINFIKESNLPVYMVEDLAWDKDQDILVATGEQEYFYYEGQVSCD